MIVHDYSIKQQEQVQELYVLMTITSKNSAVYQRFKSDSFGF